jgi:hypothetical protein
MDAPTSLVQSPALRTAEVGGRRAEIATLGAMLVGGLVIRLWSLQFPGYNVDVSLFTDWTNGLLRIPLDEYYGLVSPWCDYLPGYLYVLAATGWLKSLVSGHALLTTHDFEPWIKAGPILADLVLGAVAYSLCRRFVGAGRSLMAAALILFNPGIIFVSAVWGQVESIASALYMLALLALFSGNPILAAIWAGLGFVTKPQYAIFLGVIGIAYLRSDLLRLPSIRSSEGMASWSRWALKRVALPAGFLIAIVQLLLLPFSTSLWPAPNVEWTFYYRLTIAEIGSFASAGAFNLWGTQIAGIRQLDSQLGWLALSHQTWGFVLFAVVALLALGLAWRKSDDPGVVLGAAFLVAFGFFEVLTKMHERYLFTAIPLIAVAAAFRLWLLPYYLAISALYFVNLWYVWTYHQDIFANLGLAVWASDFSVVLFVATLVAAAVLALSAQKPGLSARGIWQSSRRWSKTSLEGTPFAPVSRVLQRPLNLRLGAALLAIGLAALAGIATGRAIEAQSSQSASPFRTVTIRAYGPWQDTGVNVTAGQRLSIVANGLWMNQMDGDLYGPNGGDKLDGGAILPSAPVGVLLGRIGRSSPFIVGEGTTITVNTSGPLQMVMNDWPNKKHGQSRGRLHVVITTYTP